MNAQLPQGANVTNVAQAGLHLRGDGGLDGQAPPNTGNTMPVVTNVEDQTVRTDLVNNLLADPGLLDNQLMTLEQLVVSNGYPGLIVDYRGVDAAAQRPRRLCQVYRPGGRPPACRQQDAGRARGSGDAGLG